MTKIPMTKVLRAGADSLVAMCFGLAMLSLGCTDSSGPTGSTGAIDITVSTAGIDIDLDPDGYLLIVDAQPGVHFDANAAGAVLDLPPGDHVVKLDGLAPNCSVAGGSNERSVHITGGKRTAAAFTVSCVANTGSVKVTTTTSGPAPDLNGYFLALPALGRVAIPSNGTLTITGVRAGEVGLALNDVSRNCQVDATQQTAKILFGATVAVAFTIQCVAPGVLEVTTTTTGVDTNPNGYGLEVGRMGEGSSTHESVPVTGTRAFDTLPPGEYRLNLVDIVNNCAEVMPNPRTVTIVAGSTTAVVFEVACERSTQLAAVNGVNDNADIFTVYSNGAEAVQVTQNATWDGDPTWSPDGGKIAFASDRDGNREIYVMNANGGNPTRLTNNSATDYRPVWSPDGANIAFVSERDGNAEIYVMNADGTHPVRLTDDPWFDGEPDWSPDGSKIAFHAERGDIAGIWIMNADGSNQVRLTSNSRGDWQPAWSPDGSRIAISHGEYDTRNIFTVNADGSELTRVTSGYPDAAEPVWSPDGRNIAFVSEGQCDDPWDYGCVAAIFTVRSDRGSSASPRILTVGSKPAWRR